jgi:hypothetical protein
MGRRRPRNVARWTEPGARLRERHRLGGDHPAGYIDDDVLDKLEQRKPRDLRQQRLGHADRLRRGHSGLARQPGRTTPGEDVFAGFNLNVIALEIPTSKVTGTGVAPAHNGTPGDDTLLGSSGADTFGIASLANVEHIVGGGGSDVLQLASNGRTIDLTNVEVSGIDRILGGSGKDTIFGSAGNDVIGGGGARVRDQRSWRQRPPRSTRAFASHALMQINGGVRGARPGRQRRHRHAARRSSGTRPSRAYQRNVRSARIQESRA